MIKKYKSLISENFDQVAYPQGWYNMPPAYPSGQGSYPTGQQGRPPVMQGGYPAPDRRYPMGK